MTIIFEVTDGIDTVRLQGSSFDLGQSKQAISQPKDGGIWIDDPLIEGRDLIFSVLQNADEALQVSVGAESEDLLYQRVNDLVKLLNKAKRFGTDVNAQYESNAVVYLKVKGGSETNTTYAVIHDYSVREMPPFIDSNIFNDPNTGGAFYGPFPLVLNRGQWLSQVPGQNTQVEISSIQGAIKSEDLPIAALSDVISVYTRTSGILGVPAIGNDGRPIKTGIRFSAPIDNSATIYDASVQVVSGAVSSTQFVAAKLPMEDADNSTAYSTGVDFLARVDTSETKNWDVPDFGVVNTEHQTESFKAQLQEVVNRDGWVKNNFVTCFIDDDKSSSARTLQASLANPHKLSVVYDDGDGYGQVASSTEKVYLANKYNTAQLTHVFNFDGVTYSSNLINSALPQTLILNNIGKDIFFGISADAGDVLGPFMSLIFKVSKLTTTAATIGFEYKYWNGAAFVAISPSPLRDNTGNIEPSDEKFAFDGLGSMSFKPLSDFATTTINGVSAYWLKLDVLTGSLNTDPQQVDQQIYTATQPWIETSEIPGTVNSLLNIQLTNESSERITPTMYSDRIIFGAKKLITADAFVPYINCTDSQNGPGVNIEFGDDTVAVADPLSSNGFKASFSPINTASASRVKITIQESVANSYYGEYRVYLRVTPHVKQADKFVSIQVSSGDGSAPFDSGEFPMFSDEDFNLVDMGQVSILPPIKASINPNKIVIDIFGRDGTGVDGIDFHDIVLIPIQVWTGEFVNPDLTNTDGSLKYNRTLDIDSTSLARNDIVASLLDDNNEVVSVWDTNSQRLEIVPDQQYRFHSLSARVVASAVAGETAWLSEPWVLHSAKVFAVSRYLTRRGDS